MGISYVRLISGDEIIGDVEDKGATLRIKEPLAMEAMIDGSGAGKRYIFMTRYAPYIDQPFIEINANLVLMHAPVSQVVAEYYSTSLAYCQKMTDKGFVSGIADTTSTLNKILNADFNSEEEIARSMLMSSLMGDDGGKNTLN